MPFVSLHQRQPWLGDRDGAGAQSAAGEALSPLSMGCSAMTRPLMLGLEDAQAGR